MKEGQGHDPSLRMVVERAGTVLSLYKNNSATDSFGDVGGDAPGFVAHVRPCALTIRKFNGKLFTLHKEEFIAVVVAAGACLVGSLGASATPAKG